MDVFDFSPHDTRKQRLMGWYCRLLNPRHVSHYHWGGERERCFRKVLCTSILALAIMHYYEVFSVNNTWLPVKKIWTKSEEFYGSNALASWVYLPFQDFDVQKLNVGFSQSKKERESIDLPREVDAKCQSIPRHPIFMSTRPSDQPNLVRFAPIV